MNRAAFDYIDLGPQQIPDIAHETREVEDRAPCVHFHQEIHVAIRPVLLRSHRAKHTDVATAVNVCKAEDLGPFLVIVTGFGPQLKVMMPPMATALTTAAEVQPAGVPWPMT